MKRFGIGSTAFLFVLFGATSCFAQDKPEQHEEKAPAQHEQKAQPTQHQEKAQTAPREQKAQPTEHASKPQQAKPATQHSQPVRSRHELRRAHAPRQATGRNIQRPRDAQNSLTISAATAADASPMSSSVPASAVHTIST